MKIAIVGTGIAGTTSAWMLARAGYDVTLFERHASLGMDALAFELTSDNREFRVDIPPRMFNSQLWPNLSRLYESIGVEIEPVDLSQSYRASTYDKTLKFDQPVPSQISALLASLVDRPTRAILRGIKSMRETADDDLTNNVYAGKDFEFYLHSKNYPSEFIDQFLFPALATTVCTCTYQSLRRYPANIMLSAMLSLVQPAMLYRTRFGSIDVVQRLTQGIEKVFLETELIEASRTDLQVQLTFQSGRTESFDHLIVATQANSALRLVSDLSDDEQQALASFKYEDIEVVLHRDIEYMPSSKNDWRHFNFQSQADEAAMCTVWMNRFRMDWQLQEPVFQTICPIKTPRSDQILCRRKMQRPLVDMASSIAHAQLAELHAQPERRIWFCGSYASPGVPLLESGVASAIAVANRLNAGWPADDLPRQLLPN